MFQFYVKVAKWKIPKWKILFSKSFHKKPQCIDYICILCGENLNWRSIKKNSSNQFVDMKKLISRNFRWMTWYRHFNIALVTHSQCENFLPLWFYVKSILSFLSPKNCHFDHFSSSEFWSFGNFWPFQEWNFQESKFKTFKIVKMSVFILMKCAKIDFT